jgi:predicted DNA-binding protein
MSKTITPLSTRLPETLKETLKLLPEGASEHIRQAVAAAHANPHVIVAVLARRIEQAKDSGQVPGREPAAVSSSTRMDVQTRQQFDEITLTLGLPATEVLRLAIEAHLHALGVEY